MEMEFTAENLEKAVTLFYRSEAVQQAQAHQWLTEAQSCPQAWSFVWELLQANRSSEVQFFAATTLHTKILRYWNEVPVDQYQPLKQKILDAIVNYAMGPKIVLNRLCITLSAYILYTIPQHWPNAFNELLTSFQPQHLPNIQPERVVWVLLEILTLIPEEFQSMNFSQSQRIIVRNELQVASKDILRVLEMYMSAIIQNSFSSIELTTYLNASRCANAWFQFGGVTIGECDTLVTYLLEICSNCYWKCSEPEYMSSDETELIEATLEAIGTIVCHPHTHKHPTIVTLQIEKIMKKLIKIVEVEREKRDIDMNILVPIYSLIISCAETHSKILIAHLLKKGTQEHELALWVIHTILMCTDTRGANPVDEECSTLTFGFWYMLQDETLSLDYQMVDPIVETVKPFYRDLISILLRKSMLPSNDDDPKWSSECKEILRCHRQDIADTMMYSYEILSMDLLNILHEKLLEAIQKCTNDGKIVSEHWPYVEACLHAYFAIAEHFEAEEDTHLPRLMEILTKIPYQKLNVKVLSTALEIIGAYACWINEHPFVLSNVIPLLLLGLQSPDVGTSATMALKDISRECQGHLNPYAKQILQTAQAALLVSGLRVAETVRLMYSIGKVLSLLPLESIMEYLNIILSPTLEELQDTLNQEQFGSAAKSSAIIKLKMLSMLFSTLDTKTKDTNKAPNQFPQPILLILQKTLPLFSQLAGKLCEDSEIMEALYSALKHAVITLLDESKPIVNELLQILVSSYRRKPLSSALDVSKQLVLMFGRDSEYSQTMHLLLCEVVNVTLHLSGGNNLSDNADVLEGFFNFLIQLFKKNPALVVREGVNLLALFQCATACLVLPELPTVKAAAGFLVKFTAQSRETAGLVDIIHTCGEALVVKIILCIGGLTSRSGLDPFSDLLLVLNKKYCDYLARWFAIIMAQEGFPSVLPTAVQKDHFVKSVLREKANKRKMQEIVKEFALICRGLIGTEYGNQASLF